MKSANLTVLGPFCMFGLDQELTLEIFQLELMVVLMIKLFYFHLLSQNKVFFRKLESLLKVQPYKLKKNSDKCSLTCFQSILKISRSNYYNFAAIYP